MSEEKSKIVSLFGGTKIGLTNKDSALAAMRKSAQLDPRGLPDGSEYLNFSGKRGVYGLGKDQEDVDPEELWLVNVYSFSDGWICWKGGRPVARRMASIYEPPVDTPNETEHGPFDASRGEGWFQAKGMMLRSLESGTQAVFTINSKSGVSVIASLQEMVGDRMAETEPEWPIIQLDKEKFTAQGQTNYKPKFEIVSWIDDDAVVELGQKEEITQEDIDALVGATTKKQAHAAISRATTRSPRGNR